jgi:hypothetical protein
MDAADIADPDPTVTIPTLTPSLSQNCSAVMAGVDGDTFMGDLEDAEAFFASSAKEKVLNNLQAATKSTHNLVKTLNLWSTNGYRLNVDAFNMLVTKLLQAVYTVSEIGLIQHAMVTGSAVQTITLYALIKSLCVQAPPASIPTPHPQPSRSGPAMPPHSSNTTSDPTGCSWPVKKAIFTHSYKQPL